MTVKRIEFEHVNPELTSDLEVTMRGSADAIIGVLIRGLPVADLAQVSRSLDEELRNRKLPAPVCGEYHRVIPRPQFDDRDVSDRLAENLAEAAHRAERIVERELKAKLAMAVRELEVQRIGIGGLGVDLIDLAAVLRLLGQ